MDKFVSQRINLPANKKHISRILDPTRPAVMYKNHHLTWTDPTRGHLWFSQSYFKNLNGAVFASHGTCCYWLVDYIYILQQYQHMNSS